MTVNKSLILRRDGVALWRQIEAAIEREIASGTLDAGARLPTEQQLSSRFGVNRHTVRRAMEELSRRGMVRVEQGRGSFVAEDVIDYTVGPRTRFSEVIRRQNREPAATILAVRELAADDHMAEALAIRPGRPLLAVDRLSLADGKPMIYGSHHFPLSRFPTMAEAVREHPTLTAALAACGVSDYLRKVTRVTARLPTAEEADLLRMPRSRPILLAEAINVDGEGRPIEFGLGRYATPRVQIVFEP